MKLKSFYEILQESQLKKGDIWYHGTEYNFDKFDQNIMLQNRTPGTPKDSLPAIFLTKNPGLALLFTDLSSGFVLTCKIKDDLKIYHYNKDLFDIEAPDDFEKGIFSGGIADENTKFQKYLISKGYDGQEIREIPGNVQPKGFPEKDIGRCIAIFDPSNVEIIKKETAQRFISRVLDRMPHWFRIMWDSYRAKRGIKEREKYGTPMSQEEIKDVYEYIKRLKKS
jgi:hypothetical protein